MTIKLIVVGRTVQKYLQEGEKDYLDRLSHYCRFEMTTIPELKNAKNLKEPQIKESEGELILKLVQTSDHLVLLDERGKLRGSEDFATWLQAIANRGVKTLVFVVGGAYGFSDAVYERANEKISLSPMTFSHQMVRTIFLEQLYRAHTILQGQPYHHK